jgi:hypothetical protein
MKMVLICGINLLQPTGYVMHQQVYNSRILHSATLFVCFVFISEQIGNFALYNANWLVFINDMKSVYCAVQTGSLYKAVIASSLKG